MCVDLLDLWKISFEEKTKQYVCYMEDIEVIEGFSLSVGRLVLHIDRFSAYSLVKVKRHF